MSGERNEKSIFHHHILKMFNGPIHMIALDTKYFGSQVV